MQPPPKALVPILFAVLVLATVAAFASAQRLKSEPLVLDKVRLGVSGKGATFTPNGDCRNDMTRIRFRLTRSDRVTIRITRPDGTPVRTLVKNRELRSYRFFRFWWDGLDNRGRSAATGPYKVMVTLIRQGRELELGGRLRLHRGNYRPTPNCDKPRRVPPRRSEADRARDEARQ